MHGLIRADLLVEALNQLSKERPDLRDGIIAAGIVLNCIPRTIYTDELEQLHRDSSTLNVLMSAINEFLTERVWSPHWLQKEMKRQSWVEAFKFLLGVATANDYGKGETK